MKGKEQPRYVYKKIMSCVAFLTISVIMLEWLQKHLTRNKKQSD
jgi:hypothetical protein